MKRARFAHGMTIFELIVVIGILGVLLVAVYGVLAQLTRAAAGSAAGSAELALSAKMAEAFRNDVRQAATAAADGKSASLKIADRNIEYARNEGGRIERRINGALDFVGPLVSLAKFELQRASENSIAMVRAEWHCSADAPPAGRVLVLDTALRTEVAP